MNVRRFLASVTLLGCCAAAQAEWRCDCTSVVDSCRADVAIRGNWVEITTDHQQCARVDYFIDGLPFVAVVVDGADRQDWIARTEDPRIMVQSCQVCRDNSGAETPAAARAAPGAGSASGALEPLIEVAPAYPAAAQARNIRGYVEVEFTVTPAGDVENPRVTAAEPADVFDQAALAAVGRWRYSENSERPAQTLTKRLDFNPPAATSAPVERVAAAGSSTIGPRNQCVRENAVYNYGEMVEIGLINACGEPLLVFGCAEGTGRYVDRWVCTDSETQQSVLVAVGDSRLGNRAAVETPAGARTYAYADRFYVTRAPNSQYWWIACAAADASCRENARNWTRAIDRQSASIDPQDRSALAIARSY